MKSKRQILYIQTLTYDKHFQFVSDSCKKDIEPYFQAYIWSIEVFIIDFQFYIYGNKA